MPGPVEVASQEFIQQDIINIKTLLYALRGVLVVSFHLTLVTLIVFINIKCVTNMRELIQIRNIFCQDGIKSGDEIEKIDSLESEELLSVACVIEKLSENFSNENKEDETGGSVSDITSQAIRQTIEENQDLKRQNILLEQKLEEKERKIKALERILVSEEKSYGLTSNLRKTSYVNSASQVL